jgi:hypothetical protein
MMFIFGFAAGFIVGLLWVAAGLIRDNVAWPDYARDPTRPEWTSAKSDH